MLLKFRIRRPPPSRCRPLTRPTGLSADADADPLILRCKRLRDYVLTHSLRKLPEGVGAAPPRKALMDRRFYNTPAPTPLKIRGSARVVFVMCLYSMCSKLEARRSDPSQARRPRSSYRRQFHVNRPHDFTRSTCVILSPRRGAPTPSQADATPSKLLDLPPLTNHNNDHSDDRENRLKNPLQKYRPIIRTLRSDIHGIVDWTLTTYIYR